MIAFPMRLIGRSGLMILLLSACILHAERYALLVGNNQGGSDRETLRYASQDVMGLKSILQSLCGFPEGNITTLINRTPQDLEKSLKEVLGRTSQSGEDVLLFYYSGHADGQHLLMGNQRFAMAELRSRLEAFSTKMRIVILDACQSGGFTRSKGGTLAEPFLFKEDSKIRGEVVLYSSSANENSHESDRFRNSIFTFHFINALRGCGDLSRDGKITLNEAYQYTYNHTVASTALTAGTVQHPGYQFKIQGEGDFVLSDLNMRSQRVVLDRSIDGRVTILDGAGALVVDFVKHSESPVMVALNPGDYRIVRTKGNGRSAARVTVGRNAIVAVGEEKFSPMALQQSRSKGTIRPYVGFGAAPSLRLFDFGELQTGLQKRFADYGIYSMYPSMALPSYAVLIGPMLQVSLPRNLALDLSYGYDLLITTGSWNGTQHSPQDSLQFSNRLSVSQVITLNLLSLGMNYRLSSSPLAGLMIGAGLNASIVGLEVRSTFGDNLYDYSAQKVFEESGTIMIPYGSVGYSRVAWTRVFLGGEIRYSYQLRSKALGSGDGEFEPLRYNLGGPEFRVRIGVLAGE